MGDSETIRVSHSHDFTMIANKAIRDQRLSFRARGLHHLLLSYPNGWKVQVEHLTGESDKDGKDAVASALKELENLGYLTRTQIRVKGKIVGYKSVIRELPLDNPPQPKGRRGKKKKESPQPDLPDTANQDTGEPQPDLPDTAKPELAKPYPAKPEPGNPQHNKYLINEVSTYEVSSEEESTPPTPKPEFSPLPQNPESQKSDLEQIGVSDYQNPGLVVKPQIPSLGQNSGGALAKIEKYQRLADDGVALTDTELKDWANTEIGEAVRCYRRSGYILTRSATDVSNEFALFVAKINCKLRETPSMNFGLNLIKKAEKDPLEWQKLASWVWEWRHGVNVGAEITKKTREQEISEALEKAGF